MAGVAQAFTGASVVYTFTGACVTSWAAGTSPCDGSESLCLSIDVKLLNDALRMRASSALTLLVALETA